MQTDHPKRSAVFSVTVDQTGTRDTHKQPVSEGDCSKALGAYIKGGNTESSDVRGFQTSGGH